MVRLNTIPVDFHHIDFYLSPLDKLAAVSQAIFSDAFSWMIYFVFLFKFHWNLLLMVQLRRIGDKLLFKLMLTRFPDSYTRPWGDWLIMADASAMRLSLTDWFWVMLHGVPLSLFVSCYNWRHLQIWGVDGEAWILILCYMYNYGFKKKKTYELQLVISWSKWHYIGCSMWQ